MPRAAAQVALILALMLPASAAETCFSAREMQGNTRAVLEAAARFHYDLFVKGNSAVLRQNAMPAMAREFAAIELAVRQHSAKLAGVLPTVRASYLLETDGNQPEGRANFYCGAYRTPEWVGFFLSSIEAGRYAIVIFDVAATSGPMTFSVVLQQEWASVAGNTAVSNKPESWRLAGLYIKPAQTLGHNSDWFLQQARGYKTKQQNRNAWFYYLTARDLLAPLPFMGTPTLDALFDEQKQVQPAELPYEKPLTLPAAGRTFRITSVFAVPGDEGLLLVLKYEAESVADNAKADAANQALSRAFLTRYPEYKQAFAGIVARGVEPSGKDFGSLLMMKDVK
ncbi:MAG: hypothetical protein ACRD2Q_12085 [Terriglobales bacterium]